MAIDPGTALAGASIASNLFNASQITGTNNDNRWAQQRQFDIQHDLALHKRTRDMQDLKDAGLNPILAAGSGGSSPPPSNVSTSQAPQIELPGFISAIQLAQNQQRVDNETKSVDANIANTLSDTALKNMQTKLTGKGEPMAEIGHETGKMIKSYIDKMRQDWKNPNKTMNQFRENLQDPNHNPQGNLP